jgi:hypothetical protein
MRCPICFVIDKANCWTRRYRRWRHPPKPMTPFQLEVAAYLTRELAACNSLGSAFGVNYVPGRRETYKAKRIGG